MPAAYEQTQTAASLGDRTITLCERIPRCSSEERAQRLRTLEALLREILARHTAS